MERRLMMALVVCAWFSATAPSDALSADQAKRAMPSVKAEDLHAGRAQIIGYLGRPLGEVVTVRGVWYASPVTAKPQDLIYRVTHINGKAVVPPVELTNYRVGPANMEGRSGRQDKDRWDWVAYWDGKLKAPDFKAGETWEFAGVESCSMRVPVYVWDERGPIMASPPDIGKHGFLDSFDFIRARRIPTEQRAVQQSPAQQRTK
jgi:hypothetical protein